MSINPADVAAHAEALGCTRKGTAARPAWYVDDRLVYRLEDAQTLTVRCTFELRERLVREHPETFGITPAMERHEKVQVVLDHGNVDVVRESVTAAVRLQRGRAATRARTAR